ncbi:MAG: hypothetical protein IJ009_01295 [Clostridia bacterium]|nr:hypothetical protein [Clostridia bacterium]
MKQRILSFVLAVCMIAVAIPVIALPAVAAEGREGFTTSLEVGGENWPVAVTDDGTNYYPEYQNGWSVGKYEYGKYYEFNSIRNEGVKPAYLTYNLLMWNANGPFLYISDGRGTLLGESANNWDGGTGPGAYYAEKNNSGTPANGQAFVYTYTAPYEGVVDISVKDLVISNMGAGTTEPPAPELPEYYKAYFSIYVNDVMVWPTEGGSITDPDDWAIVPEMVDGEKVTEVVADALKNIEVAVGDTIRFAAARYNCRVAKYTPIITYHDDYNVAPERKTETFSNADITWPVSRNTNGVSVLKQKDADWILGQFDSATKTFVSFANQKREGSEVWVCTGNDPDILGNNGILISSAFAENIGAFMVGADETNLKPAYQYTAMATGTATVGLVDGFVLIDENSEAAANASAKIAFYKNNVLLGEVTITTDANGVATASAALSAIEVVKGDKIAFVASEVSGGAVQVAAAPVVQYTAIKSFVGIETTEKYVLAMDAASIIVGDKIALSFSTYGTRDVYQDADEVKLRIWDNTVEGEKTKDNVVAEIVMEADVMGDYAYTCIYEEFAPKQMTDTVAVQAYMVMGDAEVKASEIQEVSLAGIAFEQYEKAVAAQEQEQANLMVAVLNYGAAAQKYFGYKVDDLANKNLPTELQVVEQKPDGYYSAAIMDSVDPDAALYAYSEITAASLVFESTIGIRVYVDVAPSEADKPISMRYGLTSEELAGKGEKVDGAYSFTISGIGLTGLKTTRYFQAVVEYTRKVGNKEIPAYYSGNYFSYSVEAYVARMAYETDKPELANLLHALMNLSDAAAAV